DVVARVGAATGLSEDEAKADICQAMADRAVKIRIKPEKHASTPMRSTEVVDGEKFEIPAEIKPEDMDWERSCPRKPWPARRGSFAPAGFWDLEWIELCMSDVANVLCTVPFPGAGGFTSATPETSTAMTQSALEIVHAGSIIGPELVGGARRRGVRPMKFERARDAMRSDILEGNLTPSELRDMLEKNLSEKYGVSRDTARKARDAVLSEWRQLNSRQSPTNDK